MIILTYANKGEANAKNREKKRVLKMPQNSHFISRGTETEYGINMKVEEYECIRLIDYMPILRKNAHGRWK